MVVLATWEKVSGWPVVHSQDVEDVTGSGIAYDLLGHDAENIASCYYVSALCHLFIYFGY